MKCPRFYDNIKIEDFFCLIYKVFSSRGAYMKKLCSVFICISILLSSVIFAIPASATAPDAPTVEEQQLAAAKTYYYDRLSDYQKGLYIYLKELYDTWDAEPGEYRIDVTQYVSEDYADDREGKFIADFIYADLALRADDPYYDLRWKVTGAHVDDYSTETPAYILEFTRMDLDTEENISQIDARINQIVNAIGEGDRYTKLYKLAHFFASNTFYDPYRDVTSAGGHWSHALETRGILYNVSIYGIFLENIAVCEGFSRSVKLLCNELDIPCIIMGSASHAWNLVQMEDGSWYRFDMTKAAKIGWDGERNFDDYIQNNFLNNNGLTIGGFYQSPYMCSLNGVPLVTEFPEHAEERYEYTGSTTDFSYTLPPSEYVPSEPKFVYRVNTPRHPEEKSCTIINYEGRQEGDLVIPEEIDGYKVTNIAPFAFYYCTGFDGKLVIPDTVTSIGSAAFAGCYNLTSIEFPNNISSISEGAFVGCKGLTEVTLPDSVVQVDQFAFLDCTSLEAVKIGEHIQSIGDYAFGFSPTLFFLTSIYSRYSPITIYAPEGSAAQIYANDNDIDFISQGTLCNFVDDDGEWEFLGEEHFHTCSHGVKIDVAEHTHEQGYFNCADICSVCNAQNCITYGFMEGVETIKDASPATCISPEFTGDIWCLCGETQLGFGEYIGDTIPHTPVSEELFSDEHSHWQLCECGRRLNAEAHYGGTATTTELALCEVCGAEYGELLHSHTPKPDYWDRDEYTHWQLCEDWSCDVRLNEEAHHGGTATTGSLAICEVCGVAYGDFFNDPNHEHSPIDNQWFLDDYGHYQLCACGAMFNIGVHHGGTATTTERAKCVMCGTEYGELRHEHDLDYSVWKTDNRSHWHLCECGEVFDDEPHRGGTATETERAICEICGTEYGELYHEHAPKDDSWVILEGIHYQLCECGKRLDSGSHTGGKATETERAKCKVCGAEYGELAKEIVTEATETEAVSSEPQSEAETTSEYSLEGCEAVLGMGSVSAIALSLSSFICFRKKED